MPNGKLHRPALALVVERPRPLFNFVDLCSALKAREPRLLVRRDGTPVRGLVEGIRSEDGSGRSWLVTMRDEYGGTEEVWVRTN